MDRRARSGRIAETPLVRKPQSADRPRMLSGNLAEHRKRASGFREPLCILEPLFSSARHVSKSLGLALRPPCRYAIALLSAAYSKVAEVVTDSRGDVPPLPTPVQRNSP